MVLAKWGSTYHALAAENTIHRISQLHFTPQIESSYSALKFMQHFGSLCITFLSEWILRVIWHHSFIQLGKAGPTLKIHFNSLQICHYQTTVLAKILTMKMSLALGVNAAIRFAVYGRHEGIGQASKHIHCTESSVKSMILRMIRMYICANS